MLDGTVHKLYWLTIVPLTYHIIHKLQIDMVCIATD